MAKTATANHGYKKKSSVPLTLGTTTRACTKCSLWFNARPREAVCDGCVPRAQLAKRLAQVIEKSTTVDYLIMPVELVNRFRAQIHELATPRVPKLSKRATPMEKSYAKSWDKPSSPDARYLSVGLHLDLAFEVDHPKMPHPLSEYLPDPTQCSFAVFAGKGGKGFAKGTVEAGMWKLPIDEHGVATTKAIEGYIRINEAPESLDEAITFAIDHGYDVSEATAEEFFGPGFEDAHKELETAS